MSFGGKENDLFSEAFAVIVSWIAIENGDVLGRSLLNLHFPLFLGRGLPIPNKTISNDNILGRCLGRIRTGPNTIHHMMRSLDVVYVTVMVCDGDVRRQI